MNIETRTCARCGTAKPLAEFYLRDRRKPEGPRRSHCKACMNDADRRRYNGSVSTEIVRHSYDPTLPLSPEAEGIIYTTTPPNPELVERFHQRRDAKAKREKALQRRLANRPLPMRLIRMEERP